LVAVSSNRRLALVARKWPGGINGWEIVELSGAKVSPARRTRDAPINVIEYTAAFSEDGLLVATGGDGRVVEVWETSTGRRVAVLPGYESTLVSVAFSPDDKTLATADLRGVIKLWNVATWRELLTLTQLNRPVRCLRFSPDVRTLAAATDPPGPGAPSQLTFWHAEVPRGAGEAAIRLQRQ
jgi:WD40 repeat protein